MARRRYEMSERHEFNGICVHAEEEVCPHYEESSMDEKPKCKVCKDTGIDPDSHPPGSNKFTSCPCGADCKDGTGKGE